MNLPVRKKIFDAFAQKDALMIIFYVIFIERMCIKANVFHLKLEKFPFDEFL